MAALVAFGLIGFANIICDVSGFTILQRGTPSEVLARVFGVLHSLFYATVALGAVLAPPLIHWLGVRWTLVIVGSLLPVLAVLTRASLVRLDAEPGRPSPARAAAGDPDLLAALAAGARAARAPG